MCCLGHSREMWLRPWTSTDAATHRLLPPAHTSCLQCNYAVSMPAVAVCGMETCWGTVGQSLTRTVSWQAVQRLPWTLNHGLPNVFVPVPVTDTSASVRHSHTICRNMCHFTMSRYEGTWWQFYWRRKACWVLVTLENFTQLTMHCPRCMWSDRHVCLSCASAATRPRGWTACKPSLHSIETSFPIIFKLLRDTCIKFLYTTVYFSNISNGSLCTSYNVCS
jgi:hypothetical protein